MCGGTCSWLIFLFYHVSKHAVLRLAAAKHLSKQWRDFLGHQSQNQYDGTDFRAPAGLESIVIYLIHQ